MSIPDSHNVAVGSSTKQSPLAVAKNMEKQVNQMIAQTVSLRKEGKHDEALETAKQGTKIEQSLRRHQKSNSLQAFARLQAARKRIQPRYLGCKLAHSAVAGT